MEILMLEEDKEFIERMMPFFNYRKWNVHIETDTKNVLHGEEPPEFDLIAADRNIGRTGGMNLLAELREKGNEKPVIILTDDSGEAEQVLSYSLGADAYITKDTEPLIMLAKFQAVLRRWNISRSRTLGEDNETPACDIDTERLKINRSTHEAFLDGKKLVLTPTEYDILSLLAKHEKVIFSRNRIMENIWGYGTDFADERTVDAHIKKLRTEMGADGGKLIKTVWGAGYKYDEEKTWQNAG